MGCSNTKAFPLAGMDANETLNNAMNVLNSMDSTQVKEEGEKLINQAQEVIEKSAAVVENVINGKSPFDNEKETENLSEIFNISPEPDDPETEENESNSRGIIDENSSKESNGSPASEGSEIIFTENKNDSRDSEEKPVSDDKNDSERNETVSEETNNSFEEENITEQAQTVNSKESNCSPEDANNSDEVNEVNETVQDSDVEQSPETEATKTAKENASESPETECDEEQDCSGDDADKNAQEPAEKECDEEKKDCNELNSGESSSEEPLSGDVECDVTENT